MEEDITIRRVEASEAQKLLDIGTKTFLESFGKNNSEDNMNVYLKERFTLQQIKYELENEESQFFFAVIDDEIGGYLKLNHGSSQTETLPEESIEIERIYLLSAYQGKGIGQLLLNTSIDEGEKLGLKAIWLGVWDQNTRAIQFYQRNGFTEFSQHSFMLGNDNQTDILMKRSLD